MEVKAAISVTIKENGEIMATVVNSDGYDVNSPRKIWKFSVFSKTVRGYVDAKAVALLVNLIQEKPGRIIPWSLVFEHMKYTMYQLAQEEALKGDTP